MKIGDRHGPKALFWLCLQTNLGRYSYATIAVVIAAVIRYQLGVLLNYPQPFTLFYPAILLVSLFAGFWPGLFATILSGAIAKVFFLPSVTAQTNGNGQALVLILFIAVGVTMAAIADVSRRRAARLHEFERVVEGLEEMIAVVDRGYKYVLANHAFLQRRGVRREDVIGRSAGEVLNPEAFETEIRPKLEECFQGKTVQYDMRYAHPIIGERELSVSYFPIQGRDGIDRVASVLQDVTEKRRSEHALALFRTLIDQCSDAVEVVDPATLRFIDVNDRACKDLGYTREEMLQKTVYDINPFVNEVTRENLKQAGSARFECTHRRKDGSIFPVEISLKYVRTDRGYIVGITRDISERKKVEETLRHSEQKYRALFEKAVAGVATIEWDGRVIVCNDAWAKIFGYSSPSECCGGWVSDRYANPAVREQLLSELKRKGAHFNKELQLLRKDGTPIWVLVNSVLLTQVEARPVIQTTIVDITARKHAEDALARKEEDYRRFVEQSSEGIFRQDLDSPIPIDLPEDELVSCILRSSYMAECNDAMVKMYGLISNQQFVGKRLTEFLDPDDPVNVELTREFVRAGFRVIDRESRETDSTGNEKVFRNSMIGIVENGMLLRTWGIQRDVTDQVRLEGARQQSEKALRLSEEHFRLLVEQASDGIFLADAEGKYLDVNSAGTEMLGYSREEILRMAIADIVAEEDVERIPSEVSRFENGAVARSEWRFRRKDGSFFPGEVLGRRLPDGRLQAYLRDITERRKAEEAIRTNEERFRVALNDSPITVFNQDRDLRYTWIYNPRLYWDAESIGKTDEQIVGPKKAARLTELKRRVLETGQPLREEVVIPLNGSRWALDLTVEPLFDTDKRIVGITGSAVDIAKLRELADSLQDAKDRLVREKSYLEEQIQTELGFEEIIGTSPALRSILDKTRVVAPTDSTVLLLGETGTGKELVARSVHTLSNRRGRNFIKLNCAAVPSGLLESELFGHEKGAFTGAVNQKIGRLELADQGTLFLDEIGELPLELQPKLLRVLQDREFERLGGIRTLHVDVRIVSATNRDLEHDIEEGLFREDLFYRLNVFPIELPALRERRSDIPLLVAHFVKKYTTRMGKQIAQIPDETMAVLRNWNWPGNVRELENVIERMVILTRGDVLAPPPLELNGPQAVDDDSLSEMEREHIIRVLRETDGILSGVNGAASRLGMKRTTLQSMMKRLRIDAQELRRSNGTRARR